MKYISHITDHTEKANSYLLQQYKDRPNIKALLDSIIEPMQKIEDKAYELYIQYYLPVVTVLSFPIRLFSLIELFEMIPDSEYN